MTTRISAEEYEQLVLAEPQMHWELVDGQLCRKPDMTTEHGDIIALLSIQLGVQLLPLGYIYRVEHGRLRRDTGNWFEPDLMVVSRAAVQAWKQRRDRVDRLEVFDEP